MPGSKTNEHRCRICAGEGSHRAPRILSGQRTPMAFGAAHRHRNRAIFHSPPGTKELSLSPSTPSTRSVPVRARPCSSVFVRVCPCISPLRHLASPPLAPARIAPCLLKNAVHRGPSPQFAADAVLDWLTGAISPALVNSLSPPLRGRERAVPLSSFSNPTKSFPHLLTLEH